MRYRNTQWINKLKGSESNNRYGLETIKINFGWSLKANESKELKTLIYLELSRILSKQSIPLLNKTLITEQDDIYKSLKHLFFEKDELRNINPLNTI